MTTISHSSSPTSSVHEIEEPLTLLCSIAVNVFNGIAHDLTRSLDDILNRSAPVQPSPQRASCYLLLKKQIQPHADLVEEQRANIRHAREALGQIKSNGVFTKLSAMFLSMLGMPSPASVAKLKLSNTRHAARHAILKKSGDRIIAAAHQHIGALLRNNPDIQNNLKNLSGMQAQALLYMLSPVKLQGMLNIFPEHEAITHHQVFVSDFIRRLMREQHQPS